MSILLGDRVGSDLFGFFPWQSVMDDSLFNKSIHMVGQSGMGKTQLQAHIIYTQLQQCLEDGSVGVSIIDPTGTATAVILPLLYANGFFSRPDAFERFLYVRWAENGWCFPFNCLKQPYLSDAACTLTTIEGLKRVFFADIINTSMFTTTMSAAIKTLILNDLSLYALSRLLLNKDYRSACLDKVRVADPHHYQHVLDFWTDWLDQLTPSQQRLEPGAALRRAYLAVDSPIAALSLGQQENRLNFLEIINQARFVLYDLSQVYDPDTRILLSGLLASGYQTAAFTRPSNSNLPEHFLVCDDAGDYVGDSPETIRVFLEQMRAKRCYVIAAHQNYSQANARLVGAFGEAAVKVSFGVGTREDAEIQTNLLQGVDPDEIKRGPASPTGQPIFRSSSEQRERQINELMHLPPRHAWVKLGREPTRLVRTPLMPPWHANPQRAQESRELRQHFVEPAYIEEVIAEYHRRYYVREEDVVLPFDDAWGGPKQKKNRGTG